MALQLTIIKFPPGIALEEESKTFTSGGIIGRGATTDWVLTDPERFLSSKHCQIEPEGGQYALVDLSTNGTFVNGSSEALGAGGKIILSEGDTFDVGDYKFKVSMTTDVGVFSDSPFGDAPFDSPSLGDPFADFSGEPSVAPESIYMSNEYGGASADITPDEMKVVDPLVALNIASSSEKATPFQEPQLNDTSGLIGDDLVKSVFSGSQEDSANFLQAAADWPDASVESALIPEDWADDMGDLGEIEPPQSAPPASANPFTLPDDDSLIVNKPDFDVAPKPAPAHAVPKPAQRQQPRPAPEANQNPPKPVPRGQYKEPTNGIDRSLVDAMGFANVELNDEQIKHINTTVGIMMRESLDGLMQVLRSRTSIKNEFRINITTIQPIENNPLKFSASVDEVLENMFLKESRAYKKPVDAVQESFNTIADHQVAVIAGIRSAFKSVVSQFDPIRLENQFKDSGKAGVLGGVMKGKLWSLYQEYYQSMANDMERSFQELFGDEFVQAYEDQLRKLSSARKNEY